MTTMAHVASRSETFAVPPERLGDLLRKAAETVRSARA
jgi:hypothetical protein